MEIWNFSPTRDVTHSLRSLVRHRAQHQKRNSISPCNHVLLCLSYKHFTNEKKRERVAIHSLR